MKKLAVLVCLAAAMAFAGTKSYTVTLSETAMVGGTELKPGDYKMEVQDQKLLIKRGKMSAEVPVKVEESAAKYGSTSISLASDNGKEKVEEIRLGGTHTKLVLN